MTREEIEAQLNDFGYRLDALSHNLHAGSHRSRHKGAGFSFEGTVPFEDDPDPRRINMQVSAEERELYVDQFNEEHALNVIEIGDFSASALFGKLQTKVERIALLRAGIAFAAGKHNDRIMAIGVTDIIEEEITFPLRSHRGYYSEITEKTLAFKGVRGGGGLMKTLDLLPRTPSLIFLLSDFLDDIGYYRDFLATLSGHTVVPVVLRDSVESDTPPMIGIASFKDIEKGTSASVWMGARGRKTYLERATKNRTDLESLFADFNLEELWLDGSKNDLEALIEYFEEKEESS